MTNPHSDNEHICEYVPWWVQEFTPEAIAVYAYNTTGGQLILSATVATSIAALCGWKG